MWKDEWINSKIRIKGTKIKVRKKHKETKEEKYEREKWKNFPHQKKKTPKNVFVVAERKKRKIHLI